MKRRTFIKTASALTGIGLISQISSPLLAAVSDSKYADSIGLQLWTVRNQMAEDKQKTLKAIADAGYKQVELGNVDDAKTLLPICKDLGLAVTSSFFDWNAIANPGDDENGVIEQIIADAQSAGLKHLVFGYIGKGFREKLDQYKTYAQRCNRMGEQCKSAGIKLCYHNHAFEFEKLQDEKTGYDMLIEEFDPKLVPFELDVFWAALGGWEPIATLRKLNGRVSQVHLKDLMAGTGIIYDEGKVPHEAFKELGNGTIDMAKVVQVSEEIGVEQCHVEQDQSPDPIASIGESIRYFNSI